MGHSLVTASNCTIYLRNGHISQSSWLYHSLVKYTYFLFFFSAARYTNPYHIERYVHWIVVGNYEVGWKRTILETFVYVYLKIFKNHQIHILLKCPILAQKGGFPVKSFYLKTLSIKQSQIRPIKGKKGGNFNLFNSD